MTGRNGEPCEHRYWLPLIVHRILVLSVCLNCGATKVEEANAVC